MSLSAWFYVVVFVIGAGLFCVYSKAGKLMRGIFFTASTGLLALGFLWIGGRLFELPLSLTPLSVLVSAVLGIPGVIAMLVMNLI